MLLLYRLATPSILRPYGWLLKNFKENKETTNHAIVKMLHRVAVDLKTPAMLFQLSLFCTFQTILSDPAANQYKVRYFILVTTKLQTILLNFICCTFLSMSCCANLLNMRTISGVSCMFSAEGQLVFTGGQNYLIRNYFK